jgi:hypothetical protein
MYKDSTYLQLEAKIMEALVKKCGNSLEVKIPNLIARELSLRDGSFVDIKNKEGGGDNHKNEREK